MDAQPTARVGLVDGVTDRRKGPRDRRSTDKLECPRCQSMQSKVEESYPGRNSSGYWRRRECATCGLRFTTEEVIRGTYH